MAVGAINIYASNYADHASALTGDAFGSRYTSFHNFGRFEQQSEEIGGDLIVWPGGFLAEERTDRYGFEYDGLYADIPGRPKLGDLMADAREAEATLSVVLPTARYSGHETQLREDVAGFMQDLLQGTYGDLPERMILQVGSEYYGHFASGVETAATQYGKVANAMIEEIVLALGDASVNRFGLDVEIGVQVGRTDSEDEDIRSEFGELAFGNTDMLIHHRFSAQPQGVDSRLEEVSDIVDRWDAAVTDAGGEEPEFFVSAWNVAQITRKDALSDYLAENPHVDPAAVDLAGRTTTGFERYWQERLGDFAYGEKHPGMILETFASYAEIGMDAASVYGIDVMHPGRLSWRSPEGQDHLFVGGEMVKMIYESVEGTQVHRSSRGYDPEAPAHTYAFENEDRLIVFLAGGKNAEGSVNVAVSGMGDNLISMWADSLTAGTNPDWMADFDIPDNSEVDETAESNTYLPGLRTAASVGIHEGVLQVALAPHEVVRLSFAKNEETADEIDKISVGQEYDLEAMFADAGFPTVPVPDDNDEDLFDVLEEVDEEFDGLGAAIGAVLLPFLFF